jgi:hypothetical protein
MFIIVHCGGVGCTPVVAGEVRRRRLRCGGVMGLAWIAAAWAGVEGREMQILKIVSGCQRLSGYDDPQLRT